MLYECPVCGGTLDDDRCIHCGRDMGGLEFHTCERCGDEWCIEAHGENCPNCGHNRNLPIYTCSNCGAPLSDSSEFCDNCGSEN